MWKLAYSLLHTKSNQKKNARFKNNLFRKYLLTTPSTLIKMSSKVSSHSRVATVKKAADVGGDSRNDGKALSATIENQTNGSDSFV